MALKTNAICALAAALIVLAACQSESRNNLTRPTAVLEKSSESALRYVSTESTLPQLPVRSGERIHTTGSVPHVQMNVQPNHAINDTLVQFAFSLPGVTERPTRVSLPGAKGMWLDDSVSVERPDVILSGREFAHIHPDGSLHAPLSVERAREVAEKGWGELHPWSGRRRGMDGFVMIFSPLNENELETVKQLIVDSYNHVTGQNLSAAAI